MCATVPWCYQSALSPKGDMKEFCKLGYLIFPLGPNAGSVLQSEKERKSLSVLRGLSSVTDGTFHLLWWSPSPCLQRVTSSHPQDQEHALQLKQKVGVGWQRGKAMEWRFGVSKHRSVTFWYQEVCLVPSTVPLCALSILKGLVSQPSVRTIAGRDEQLILYNAQEAAFSIHISMPLRF